MIDDVQILWDLEDDPDGNVQHIAANGVTVAEYVEVFGRNCGRATISRETGRPIAFGFTSTGKHIAIVWEEVQRDPLIIRPVTAFETPPRRRRQA